MAENEQKDPRLQAVEAEKQEALAHTDALYGGLIEETDQQYQNQIDGVKDYAQTQTQLQQDETELGVEQIRQQQEQAARDYEKEQSAAYTDYQKQSNPYGIQAEAVAGSGLTGSGYSESARVSMYNTYQNRVAAAQESYGQAVREYDRAIREAWQRNSAALAQIAYDALQTQINLSLKAINQHSQLALDWEDRKLQQEKQFDERQQQIRKQIAAEQGTEDDGILAQNAQLEKLVGSYQRQMNTYEATIRDLQDRIAGLMTQQPSASAEPAESGAELPGGKSENLLTQREW